MVVILQVIARSIWHQGIRSSYRKHYWTYFAKILARYALDRPKLWLGVTILISGHHFIPYARDVERKIERELENVRAVPDMVVAPMEN
jgi:hypothetical protein